jgi:hypothetical protein
MVAHNNHHLLGTKSGEDHFAARIPRLVMSPLSPIRLGGKALLPACSL